MTSIYDEDFDLDAAREAQHDALFSSSDEDDFDEEDW
jgi:hypothetical protein